MKDDACGIYFHTWQLHHVTRRGYVVLTGTTNTLSADQHFVAYVCVCVYVCVASTRAQLTPNLFTVGLQSFLPPSPVPKMVLHHLPGRTWSDMVMVNDEVPIWWKFQVWCNKKRRSLYTLQFLPSSAARTVVHNGLVHTKRPRILVSGWKRASRAIGAKCAAVFIEKYYLHCWVARMPVERSIPTHSMTLV